MSVGRQPEYGDIFEVAWLCPATRGSSFLASDWSPPAQVIGVLRLSNGNAVAS